jgi:hypothetical protein
MSDDKTPAAEGWMHLLDARNADADPKPDGPDPGIWREVECGEHDWHRPDPMKNPRCRRCGLYDAKWSGDGCPDHPVRQRLHQIGPLAPFESSDLPPLVKLVTDEDVRVAREAGMAATDGVTASDPHGEGVDYEAVELRAALEAYGARLLTRVGRTG